MPSYAGSGTPCAKHSSVGSSIASEMAAAITTLLDVVIILLSVVNAQSKYAYTCRIQSNDNVYTKKKVKHPHVFLK
jgi:hypothetical protein